MIQTIDKKIGKGNLNTQNLALITKKCRSKSLERRHIFYLSNIKKLS